MPDRSHTIIFLAQLPNGEMRTSRMIADIPMTADQDKYIACAKKFFQCFDAELISVTKVDEHHHVQVICGGEDGLICTNTPGLRVVESIRSWNWWRFNAWATMTLLLVANLSMSVFHFMTDQAADTWHPWGQKLIEDHFRPDGSLDRLPIQRQGPTGSP